MLRVLRVNKAKAIEDLSITALCKGSFHGSFSRKPSSLRYTFSRKPSITPTKTLLHPNTQVQKIFNKFDSNGDGKISFEEYKQAIGSAGATKDEAAETFRVADADGDGFIDLKEFSKVYGSDGGVKSGEIQAAFRVFDRDGDGKISAEELMEVLRRMGERCSLQECKNMIKGVDRDGDGLIDMDEFASMMNQNIKN